jgi:hypothetical protein
MEAAKRSGLIQGFAQGGLRAYHEIGIHPERSAVRTTKSSTILRFYRQILTRPNNPLVVQAPDGLQLGPRGGHIDGDTA